jgi:hypothetical protein
MLRSTRTKVFVLLLIAGLSSWMLFRTGVVQGLGAPKPVFSQICAGQVCNHRRTRGSGSGTIVGAAQLRLVEIGVSSKPCLAHGTCPAMLFVVKNAIISG